MATLTKKDLLEAIETFRRRAKKAFCECDRKLLIKIERQGKMLIHYWECPNCGKIHKTYYKEDIC